MNPHFLPGRNLKIGRHPFLNRPYPEQLHHWTEAELERFLDENKFPRNSNGDGLAWRRHCVIEALTIGEYVPQQVLDEQPDLMVEAQARHKSNEALAGLNTRIAAARDSFEFLIGYSVGEEIYHSSLVSLLTEALARHSTAPRRTFSWRATQVCLAVDNGRPPQWGTFGPVDAGRPKSLKILPTSNSVWALHAVEWRRVESTVAEMLRAGAITLEHVWALFGTGWVPESMRRGGVSISAPVNADAALA